ncbi:hypothetical protein NEOC65_001232 [Neochlamydia sp. AcF65]|nr:hypothetical protein [Neochlamydia sp. AcF65]
MAMDKPYLSLFLLHARQKCNRAFIFLPLVYKKKEALSL